MDRTKIINQIWIQYHTSNIEWWEYSYVKAAWWKENLSKLLGYEPEHYKLDIRFFDEQTETVVLIETKQKFNEEDENQLREYLDEERAIHSSRKVICILANTTVNDKIKVRRSFVDNSHVLKEETVIDKMDHYIKLFNTEQQNDRETVMRNTYYLNEELHKLWIEEGIRSQFVWTSLLYVKYLIDKTEAIHINNTLINNLNSHWRNMISSDSIRNEIKETLWLLLDWSKNKEKKIELLQKNVLWDQHIKDLTIEERIKILDIIIKDIYRYIDINSNEWQDILNLFFITFNKYAWKKNKNQAFTPDHITEFMCTITEVNRNSIVLDWTCWSGSFLVQAMMKELADCRRWTTDEEQKILMNKVKMNQIFWIELDEIPYGLSTTNMLIHSDWNSNIIQWDLFKSAKFIEDANPDIILMNPPYNAVPKWLPDKYKKGWKSDAKQDPTKGLVFIKFISDTIKEINKKKEQKWEPVKLVKCAVLLPVSVAIWTDDVITDMKKEMLEDNTLEAVFTLPWDIFYPGASASACCMVFTMWKPHSEDKETFFWYYKDDWFKKKKNVWRVEQFDNEWRSKWRILRDEWISLYKNKKVIDWKSAVSIVKWEDERLCEAYMETDFSKLSEDDFQKTLNNYLWYLVKEWDIYES